MSFFLTPPPLSFSSWLKFFLFFLLWTTTYRVCAYITVLGFFRTIDGTVIQEPAACSWQKDLGSLPGIDLPYAIVFLINHGWSTSMINNYKFSDGWKLHDDGHIDNVSST